jgi:hypothetical protein
LDSKRCQEREDQHLGLPTDPIHQEFRAKRIAAVERELAKVKRFKDLELAKGQRPPGEQPLPPQRVLTEVFCVNRLREIRKLAGNSKLKDFTKGFERDVREEEISRVFKRFRCENVDGDPPYFCVSAAMMGRLIHTFKEEYLSRDKVRRTACELDLHVDEIKSGLSFWVEQR